MPFVHEKLVVYHKVLAFIGSAEQGLQEWPRTHAFVDHLSRASESIVSNLVQGVRARGTATKHRFVDYAIGSAMECGACMDIACLKGLSAESETAACKHRLVEIVKMLIGLRKSWGSSCVRETAQGCLVESTATPPESMFHHESLEMYRCAIDFYRWFLSQEPGRVLAGPFERRVDKFATCILLNVAEGNGRFAVLDQGNFLGIANATAAKTAAYLDVGVQKGLWTTQSAGEAKTLLVSIGRMTASRDYGESDADRLNQTIPLTSS